MDAPAPALLPANEESRLRALQPYKVLTALPDIVFDEVARLAAKLFDVPIALISLVDADAVWFKANFGMAEPQQVARQQSMCSVAILRDETTVFEDLDREPCRLVDPQVGETLQMRFYAGHPLQSEGYNIGTMCLIGRQARHFSSDERGRLQALAEVVSRLLQLRVALLDRSGVEPDLWLSLYEELDQYLSRIDTLKELALWEDDATSLAALAYQQSIADEADIVISTLQQHIQRIENDIKKEGN
ncbi:GAF domain-containing protein [Hymenobacter sp.]|jgi:GAF domain-containing protein|uniref:GAF domain-containing protein n=1 Tax=Hymenobacter sp. TaxID=1898978 RepID=UPI002EDB92A4